MQHVQIFFLALAQIKDLLLLMLLKSKKGATMINNTSLINSSLWQLKFLDASTNKLMRFYTIVLMPFRFSNG
jgi:hypothetical protein